MEKTYSRRSFSKLDILKNGSSFSLPTYNVRNGTTTKPSNKPLLPEKLIQALQLFALIIILTATVMLFSLPIIFRYVSIKEASGLAATDTTTLNNCSNTSKTLLKLPAPVPCQYQLYTGTCMPHLDEMQRCLIETESQDIRIMPPARELDEIEADLSLLDALLNSFPECKAVAVPFLCRYYFPLSDCSTGYIYSASREDCINITTTVCSVPWTLVQSLGYGDELPNCQELPSSYSNNTNTTLTNGTPTIDTPIPNNQTFGDENVTCLEGFMMVDSLCQPVCHTFQQYPPSLSDAVVYSEVTAGCMALIVAIVILVCAAKSYKKMFNYHSIMVIFMMLDYTVIASLTLVIAIDRANLMCSSSSLVEAFDKPTILCKISGAVFHYGIVNVTIWWFFHVSIFLYKIMFPFHAKRLESLGHQKYVLLIMILTGLLLPLPAVIVSLSVDKYTYKLSRLPPSFCGPDTEVWFYSAILVIDVLLCLGVCFLVVIFWEIHKHQKRQSGKKYSLSTAEKKVMLVICSFIVFGVITMTQSSLVLANDDLIAKALQDYFLCESVGHTPGKCNRDTFVQYTYPYLSIAAYLLLGLIPISILNFVVNWQSIGEFCCKKFAICGKILPKQEISSAEPSGPSFTTSTGTTTSTL